LARIKENLKVTIFLLLFKLAKHALFAFGSIKS